MITGKFIRIVCEGKTTEPNYFRPLLKRRKISSARVHQPKDHSPLGVVTEARKLVNEAKAAKIPKKDISVWAVFDRDGHMNIDRAVNMAKDNGINIAFSNVCFEYWIILHFEKCTRPFKNCDEILSYLKTKFIPAYSKSTDYYELLSEKIPSAIQNNKWLIEKHWGQNPHPQIFDTKTNPYTNLYELMTFIMSQ